ncbi:MAG: hypothetical protein KDA72_15365, partial [Planctomycetales bacterium]|nr:hypothetical protein [Planctomycetales bacterium]
MSEHIRTSGLSLQFALLTGRKRKACISRQLACRIHGKLASRRPTSSKEINMPHPLNILFVDDDED